MGAACADALAGLGYRVAGVDRTPAPGLITADVTDPAQAAAAVAAALDRYGRLDAAVNAAGVAQDSFARTAELAVAEWRRVMSVNLDGVFFSMRAEIPAILASGGGAIVNFGSTLSVAGSPSGVAAYAAAKHAVLGLTRAAALEYAADGLRVNAVGPGIIATPMTEVWDEAKRASQIAKHPAGRFGTVAEVAALVAYLISPHAGFVTGSFYPIDGGFGAQ